MSDYRELGPDEIVMKGDEVLNQIGSEDWTTVHGYAGKAVKDCKGYTTKKQRIFRRKETTTMKYKVGDKVRVIKAGSHRFKVGEVVEITELFPDDNPPHYRADSLNDHWYVTDDNIEPLHQTTLITKPIDFTGCHPEIAEALKQGLSVKCKVWDAVKQSSGNIYGCGYAKGSAFPYLVINGVWFKNAKPVTTKRVLKPIEETIPLLLQNGWRFNGCDDLYIDNNTVSPAYLQENVGRELDDDNLPDYLFKEIDQ